MSEPAITFRPRRSRRIASDEAHAWARNLRLKNPHAKLVLAMLTGYVNSDGACFVGIEHLAEDTELSTDTVRRRLAWLEEVGVIVRLPQWVDTSGRRNSDGKGKRTTDEIRLLIDGDPEEIAERINGGGGGSDGEEGEQTPSQQPGLPEPEGSVSPAPALCQPLHSGKGLISEPEPEQEDSPPAPPRGGADQIVDQGVPWTEFEVAWREPIVRQGLSTQVWSALSDDERNLAIRAAKGYRIYRAGQSRPPALTSAQTFLKERYAWSRFAPMAPAEGQAAAARQVVVLPRASREGLAVSTLYALAAIPPPINTDGDFTVDFEITPQLLALADAPHKRDWPLFDNRQQLGAWNNLVRVIGRTVHAGDHVINQRFRTGADGQQEFIGNDLKWGFKTPWPWPPRKDGTITTGPPDVGLSTDDDLQELAKG